MNRSRELLPRALRDPAGVAALDPAAWDLLIRQARVALVMPRLCILAEDAGVLGRVPEAPRRHLVSARLHAAKHERVVRWEANRIERALRDPIPVGVPIVLLKGAAYTVAGLPPARGRVVSDVDILVPRERIADVERALLAHGWSAAKLDAYDQRYYRQWMHELPPLHHRGRGTTLDVHHNILPPTVKLAPDARKLLDAAVPISPDAEAGERPASRLRVLSPEDMTLHSAAHLFYDGELEHGLRDLVDLDALMRHFAATRDGFFDRLTARAAELRLDRPLYYALRYAHEFLGTPVAAATLRAARRGAPPAPVARVMDFLFRRALAADHATCADAFTPAARWLLYVRSHHLRMPPHLLVPHLVRKALHRRFADEAA